MAPGLSEFVALSSPDGDFLKSTSNPLLELSPEKAGMTKRKSHDDQLDKGTRTRVISPQLDQSLGVPSTASSDKVRRVFFDKALRYDPDLHPRGDQQAVYNPSRDEEDSRAIEVKMWNPVKGPALPFETFQVDLRKYDMGKILTFRKDVKNAEGGITHGVITTDLESSETQRLKQHMSKIYEEAGVVHLVNTPMTSGGEFQALTKMLFDCEDRDYTGGTNLRKQIEKVAGGSDGESALEKNVFDTGVPGAAAVHYHHEMEYIGTSCEWISFGCMEGTKDAMKAATYISDSNAATDMMLKSELGQKLMEKGVCFVRKLPCQKFFKGDPDLVFNYWQTCCNTEDPEEAAEIMRKKGLDVSWEDSRIFGRQMITKYYACAFEYDPTTGRNTLFSSVSNDYVWFDSWPKIKDLPHWEKPMKLTFGDGAVMTREEKQFFADCYGEFGTPIAWKKGDLAIINNLRHLHGRPSYHLEEGEKRSLAVILGPVFNRQGEKQVSCLDSLRNPKAFRKPEHQVVVP